MNVDFFNLSSTSHINRNRKILLKSIKRGNFILGKELKKFEMNFANIAVQNIV